MKINIFSIYSVDADKCSSKRVLILHVLPLTVGTAFWSGDIRGILPQMNINSQFPPWSVTNMVELNYRLLWKAPYFS